jgi:hypothetical protein
LKLAIRDRFAVFTPGVGRTLGPEEKAPGSFRDPDSGLSDADEITLFEPPRDRQRDAVARDSRDAAGKLRGLDEEVIVVTADEGDVMIFGDPREGEMGRPAAHGEWKISVTENLSSTFDLDGKSDHSASVHTIFTGLRGAARSTSN